MKLEKIIHAGYRTNNDKKVPFIRMSGKWLEKAGFFTGSKIKVNVQQEKLTLSKVPYLDDDSIDDLIQPTESSGVEKVVDNTIKNNPDSISQYKGGDYRGYTVRLKIERDTKYSPIRLLSPNDVYNFLKPMQEKSREVMLSLMLDSSNSIVGVYEASKGGINRTAVYPSEIFKSALLANSTSIILAHNHPSGDPKPSNDDINFTEQIKNASSLMGMKLLDHVIIGYGRYKSLKDLGYIQ